MFRKQPIANFWLICWSLVLAIGWLLPNHQVPWTAFHMDAWVAIVLLLISFFVLVGTALRIAWHSASLVVLSMALLPVLQYSVGQVLLGGAAWMGSVYLLGFLLALLTGAAWESKKPGQLADGLFLAVGMAAILSVALQLHQWLGLDISGDVSMGDGYGRPFANFGQPNQLATFLLWGLISVAWGLVRQRLGVLTALLASTYLLFGLALTQSRSAWVAIVLLTLACWIWRRCWLDKRVPWLAMGLLVYFVLCVISLNWLTHRLLLNMSHGLGDINRISGELRPVVWAMFLDAVAQQPWLGYGWNQAGLAQLEVALDHQGIAAYFAQSHNLFLDLILWCGIPLGVSICIFLMHWIWTSISRVRNAEDALLVAFVIVVGNHAMWELPLHYAYLLLPTGLMMGALSGRLWIRPICTSARWIIFSIWFAAAALLAVVIRDYSRVETSYQELRFEWAGIKTEVRGTPPDVLVLTHLRHYILLSRVVPTMNMSTDELRWMSEVVRTFPSSGAVLKLATALALNQRPEEAKNWLNRICKITPASECAVTKILWVDQSIDNLLLAAVRWPD